MMLYDVYEMNVVCSFLFAVFLCGLYMRSDGMYSFLSGGGCSATMECTLLAGEDDDGCCMYNVDANVIRFCVAFSSAASVQSAFETVKISSNSQELMGYIEYAIQLSVSSLHDPAIRHQLDQEERTVYSSYPSERLSSSASLLLS
jgi:hypothetical protein